MNKSMASLPVERPWLVIFTSLLLVAGIGYFLQFVQPSVNFKDMLGENYPGLTDYDYLQTQYIPDDNLLVLIEAKSGDAFEADILSGVYELTAALWKTPFSARVDSVTNFQFSEANGDDLVVDSLVPDPALLTEERLAKVKHIALNDPIALHGVVNPEGNVLAINVTFNFPLLAPDEKLIAYDFVDSLAAGYREQFPQTNVYVGGMTALDATVMNLSMQETVLFLALVLIISIVLLMLLLRVVLPVLAVIPMLLFSVICGMALAGMMGWKLTPFTTTVPMIILIIGIADAVHLITVYMQQLNKGESKKAALAHSITLNRKAIFITSITTAIGFLTLNFSGSTSIAALGNEAAFGVMIACLLSLTFLPAVLVLLPVKTRVKKASNTVFYESLTDKLFNYRKVILSATAVIVVGLALSATQNEFNDRIPTYFDKSLPWRQANDFSEEQFGSAYNFTYSLNSGQVGGVANPQYLADVEKFTQYLRSIEQVSYVKSIADTFKRLNKNMHGDDPQFYKLPEDRALAAQYLLLYEMSLPFGLGLDNQINHDKSATKLLASFQSMSVSEVLIMEAAIDEWLKTNLPHIEYVGSGVQIMFAHLMERDTKGLTLGAIYGLLIISMLLIVMLKSWRIGVLSVLPNLVPIIAAFGVWGLLVTQVGFGLAMVSGMSIGVIVDDTVHFLTKYLHARHENGLDAKQAVTFAFETVAPSIVFTTLVLVVGFLSMVLVSEFRVNTDMGKMTAIIMLFALVFDLIVLPVLLMVFDRDKSTNAKVDN